VHSICDTRILHSLDVVVSVLPMVAWMVLQVELAVIYMWCPVSVPHTRGGLGPVGLDITRLSSTQAPLVNVVLEASAITNFSKSILNWQISVEVGQMV